MESELSSRLPSKADPVVRRRSQLTIESRINFSIASHAHEDSEFSRCRHPAQESFTPGKVVSIWGKATAEKDVFQPYFSHRGTHFDGTASSEDPVEDHISLMQHSVGVLCQRGQKPDSPNQDDFVVLSRREWLLFGVFDGHGPRGHDISHFVQEHLPQQLLDRLLNKNQDWSASCKDSFEAVNGQLLAEFSEQAATSGSTTSVAILNSEGGGAMRLRCAHVGDSCVVYAKRSVGEDPWQVSVLTDPHKPDRIDESERIVLSGGEVQPSPGEGFPARLLTNVMDLAMSRSFGDFYARTCGLISEPELSAQVLLEAADEHIILACSDGVWDVVSPYQAVQIVSKFQPCEAQKAVEKLVQKAQHRWQEMHGGAVDDITKIRF